MADLNHLGRAAGRRSGRRAARPVRSRRRGGPAGVDVLGRDAPPARPGDDAGRLAAGDLPRRADDRARPAQPPRTMWDEHPRAGRRRRHDLPHHPVPRRGRRARRPDRRPRPRPDRRRGHPGRAQAAHPRRPRPPRSSPTRTRCARPPRLLDGARPDEERARPPACPSDGGVASLRRLLEQLDDAGVEVEQLSIHTPDLDDVFFAVTGHADPTRRPRLMTTLAYTVTDSATMLRRNLRRLRALPVDDAAARRHADRVPAAVRLRLRRPAQPRPRHASSPAATPAVPATSTTSRPASC